MRSYSIKRLVLLKIAAWLKNAHSICNQCIQRNLESIYTIGRIFIQEVSTDLLWRELSREFRMKISWYKPNKDGMDFLKSSKVLNNKCFNMWI